MDRGLNVWLANVIVGRKPIAVWMFLFRNTAVCAKIIDFRKRNLQANISPGASLTKVYCLVCFFCISSRDIVWHVNFSEVRVSELLGSEVYVLLELKVQDIASMLD